MKEITWQLVRGAGLASRLIGWFGSGTYSHIDVITPQGALRGARSDVLRGVPPGYRDRPQGYETWVRQTRYNLDVTDDQYARYWDFSDRQLGKPYDSRGLVETFLIGREWRDDDAWWCSEEVAANMEYAWIMQALPPEVLAVEPKDCADYFVALGARRQEMID